MKKSIFYGCIVFGCAFLCAEYAFADLQVQGLFKDKIVIEVDGKPRVVRVGEEVEGMKLISADSKECVVELDGQTQTVTMGNQMSIKFAPSTLPIVRVMKDPSGLYRYSGTINGQSVSFIIDTGATIVAMNENQAKQLGINYTAQPTSVETASGKSKAYSIVLDQITLGGIKVYNIPAVVVQGDSPKDVLLGMSFLQRVEIHDKHQILEIKQKY